MKSHKEELENILPCKFWIFCPIWDTVTFSINVNYFNLWTNFEFDEYKERFGKTIITAYARIDGWAVGIVAKQRKEVKWEKVRGTIVFFLWEWVPSSYSYR